jgi:hypothetical protein
MKRALSLAVGGLIVITACLYVGDYAWLRLRISRNQNAYDTMQVEIVEQIPQKGNKAEYVPEEPQTQICVRSLFPHLGDQPCWYLRRHTQQQVNF